MPIATLTVAQRTRQLATLERQLARYVGKALAPATNHRQVKTRATRRRWVIRNFLRRQQALETQGHERGWTQVVLTAEASARAEALVAQMMAADSLVPAPDPLAGSPYGRKPRSVLAGYAPIPYSRHVRGYGRGHDEFLVEEHEDGTVTLLPSDAMPCAWRTIWRRATTTSSPKEA